MQKLIALLILVCSATLTFASATLSLDEEAINKICPIAEESIDGKTFATYAGHRIGFCCPGCDKKFLAWDKSKKDAFVKASLTAREGDGQATDAKEAAPVPSEPYTLATCPVSGEKLGSMGKPIVLEAGGSEVKLCCKGCTKKFKADTDKYMKVVRAGLAAQQLPYYPVDTCLVSGDPLTDDGKDIAEDVVIGNRLFRVCCKGCIKALRKDTGKYMAELNAAAIKKQAEHYPLSTCIVRGKSKLGSMGNPVQRVVGNRLVQLCCKGCEPTFNEDPAKFIAALDAAWAEHHSEHGQKDKSKDKSKATDHKHGSKGHGETEGH